MIIYKTKDRGSYNVTEDKVSKKADETDLAPDPEDWKECLKECARSKIQTAHRIRLSNLSEFSLKIVEDDEFDEDQITDDADEDNDLFFTPGLHVNMTEEEIICTETWAASCLHSETGRWVVMNPEEWEEHCENEEAEKVE